MAILLTAGSVLRPVGGSITLTSGSHDLDCGVIDVPVKDRDTTNMPV